MLLTIPDFYASKLNNYRTIYVYLPPDYQIHTDKRYPVLYMQDGQNIFDPSTSSAGKSWGIHHTADRLIREVKIQDIIIAGIEFKDRTREYTHTSWSGKKVKWNEYAQFEYSLEGKGELYEDFLIRELKPYMDTHFRTLPDKMNTALMGASSGGLVTLNIGLRHPEIFNAIGMMSPAFFAMDFDSLKDFKKVPLKMWFDTGEMEPCLMEDTKQAVDFFLSKGYVEGKDLIYYQVPDGFHSDQDWGERAAGPLIWFFGDIGKPVCTRQIGRETVGLGEDGLRINPVVYYDSGLVRSDLNAAFTVENPEILEVTHDGTIVPKMAGSTRIDYTIGDIHNSKRFQVMEGLTSQVRICFEVEVPENTPMDAVVFADTHSPVNLPLKRGTDNIYRGCFMLPRGFHVKYKLKQFSKTQIQVEKNTDQSDTPFRDLYAVDDLLIHGIVNSWV